MCQTEVHWLHFLIPPRIPLFPRLSSLWAVTFLMSDSANPPKDIHMSLHKPEQITPRLHVKMTEVVRTEAPVVLRKLLVPSRNRMYSIEMRAVFNYFKSAEVSPMFPAATTDIFLKRQKELHCTREKAAAEGVIIDICCCWIITCSLGWFCESTNLKTKNIWNWLRYIWSHNIQQLAKRLQTRNDLD